MSMNNIISKANLLLILVILGLFSFSFAQVRAVNDDMFDEKRVLFISSYNSSFDTFYKQIEGINDTFSDYPVVVDMEFMDSKRFLTPENIENFKTNITYKLDHVSYDLVLVSDDNALIFVMENREELFQELPIIFFGINNEDNARTYSELNDVTGVIEAISIEDTIDIALQINPRATKVLGIFDNTPSGIADKVRFYDKESKYSAKEFIDLDLTSLSLSELEEGLSLIEDDTIVLLFSALRDKNGISYDFYNSTERIVESSTQPVYHLFEHGIGEGLIGGRVISHYMQASSASLLALDYFKGAPFSDLQLIVESPNVYIFDYEVLVKNEIETKTLPDSTLYLNRNLTLFEEYSTYIYVYSLVVVLLVIVLVVLFWSSYKQNKSRQETVLLNEKLTITANKLEETNKELRFASRYDSLTKLYNRNHFENELLNLESETEYPISIILVDLNGLKLINDAFGHQYGDQALIKVATLLDKTFSKGSVSRIGGDEFAVIHTGVRKRNLLEMMKKVRKNTNEIRIQGVSLSVSLGLAYMIDKSKSINEIFGEAEDWMYREKLMQTDSNRNHIINTVINTLNQKDEYSEEHSKRVSKIAVKIAELLEFDEQKLTEIRTAGLLHDIGKIIVPSTILNKNGKLTISEYEEIKKHSEIGYRILFNVSSMRNIAEIVYCHHERIDGKGYPRGLKSDEIPVQAKIISIADAIDTMLTDRIYRSKLTKEQCSKEIEKYKGTQFCPDISAIVIQYFDEICNAM